MPNPKNSVNPKPSFNSKTGLNPQSIPLSLYIHIPWCVQKCPYCDFNSHSVNAGGASQSLPENDYVEALIADLKQERARLESLGLAARKIHSIFIGGGTPSLFSAKAIDKILQAAEREFGFVENIEITLEANPGTAEQKNFSGYRKAGVNRLSIGVQSFSDPALQALGRIHSSDEAQRAVAMARTAGFDNINLDLMHGLPDQALSAALYDLEQAIALTPEHISWYQLTIEPNTAFYNSPPILPIDDTLAEIQEQGQGLLHAAGFMQYEVSAYGKKQRQSQHNLNYWRFGDYIGIGAGAHGKLTTADAILRNSKTRQPKDYLNYHERPQLFLAQEQAVAVEDRALEFMMNALRLKAGVDSGLYLPRTGLTLTDLDERLQELRSKGLLVSSQEQLATTELGFWHLNSVLGQFS